MMLLVSSILVTLTFTAHLRLCAASSLRGQERREASEINTFLKDTLRASKGSLKPELNRVKSTLSHDSNPQQLVTGTDDALYLGYSVSFAGDVNGDGIDDVIVGAPRKTFNKHHQEVGAAFVIFGQEGSLPDLESIDYLDGTNGFALYGNVIEDQVGYAVSYAGDVNGDGFADVLIGAPGVDGFDIAGSGQVYCIFGADTGFPAVVDLSSIDGSNGFIIQGNGLQDYLGSSVSYAGDFNGDGIDDIVVGAPNADNLADTSFGGEAYVIFGSTSGFPETLFITDLDGSNGFTIEAESDNGVLGRTVAFAGDVNGDGIADLLVAATGMEIEGMEQVGATYVLYGGVTDFAPTFNVGTLDGTNGYKIYGTSGFDEFGHALSTVGDVNGDGIDDFIVGCPNCRPTGKPYYAGAGYIFYGTNGPMQTDLLQAASANSIVFGENAFDGLGQDVSSAGDWNGDGIPDILIGSGRSIGDGHATVHVIYGSSSDLEPSVAVQTIEDGSSFGGETISMYDSDFVGTSNRMLSVSFAGDFNHDGTTDIIVGLPSVKFDGGDTVEGHVKVVLGSSSQA